MPFQHSQNPLAIHWRYEQYQLTVLFLYRFNQQRNFMKGHNIDNKDDPTNDPEPDGNLEIISSYGVVLQYRQDNFSKESDLP